MYTIIQRWPPLVNVVRYHIDMNSVGVTRRPREQYLTWTLIKRAIGNCSRWPLEIRVLFWQSELSYSSCIRLAAFAYINKLDRALLELWFMVSKTLILSAKETIRWLLIFIASSDKYTFVTYEARRDCAVLVNGTVVNPFGYSMNTNRLEGISYL